MIKSTFLLAMTAALTTAAPACAQDTFVRYNQVGYLPTQEKVVVIDNTTPKKMRHCC